MYSKSGTSSGVTSIARMTEVPESKHATVFCRKSPFGKYVKMKAKDYYSLPKVYKETEQVLIVILYICYT